MARLLDTNVRYFDNTVTTSQLNNSWGCLVDVLDEVLLKGSNEQSILSIITVEDPEDSNYWLSTIYLNPNHKFEKEIDVVEIKGVGDPVFDTVFRVQSVAENYITVAFDKLKTAVKPSDFSTLSNATVKLAPLGYIKTFSESGKAIYKTGSGNDCYLRVDNTTPTGYDPSWLKFARVSIYSEINSFYDFYPRPGRLKAPYYTDDPVRAETEKGSGSSGSYGESKWYYGGKNNSTGQEASATDNFTCNFEIIGDDKTFYFFIRNKEAYNVFLRIGYCFGHYENIFDINNINNHILCSTQYSGNSSDSGPYYYSENPGGWERYTPFGRVQNSIGKYLLNSLISGGEHLRATFAAIGINGSTSRDTYFNFKREIQKLNYSEVFLKAIAPSNSYLIGKMRGYYMIANNLQDDDFRKPELKSVYCVNDLGKNKYFINLSVGIRWTSGDTEYSSFQHGRIGFLLNDWSD